MHSQPRLPVSEELASGVRRALTEDFNGMARGVRTEIQDGGLFLFVEVELTTEVTREKAKELCEAGKGILDSRIPARAGNYSWILNLTKGSQIVRSVSGGWLDLQ
jgi:hypothetical protein